MRTYRWGEVSAGLPRTVPLPRVADRPGGKPGGHDASGEFRRALALLRIACPPRDRGACYWYVLGRAANGPSWVQSADKSR
jgi:hypothetical protein